MKPVEIGRWGKDHFSLLAYVEDRCVNAVTSASYARLEARRMRVNPERRPLLAGDVYHERKWDPAYGTRLSGFFHAKADVKERLQLKQHDDIDCLEDLEAAGLVEVRSLVNLFVKMTDLGNEVAAALRKHKTSGHNFAQFCWPVRPSVMLLEEA